MAMRSEPVRKPNENVMEQHASHRAQDYHLPGTGSFVQEPTPSCIEDRNHLADTRNMRFIYGMDTATSFGLWTCKIAFQLSCGHALMELAVFHQEVSLNNAAIRRR
jgi:hypothetical protein